MRTATDGEQTWTVHMPLDLLDETPYLRTTVRILETKSIIYSIGLGPDNECICSLVLAGP